MYWTFYLSDPTTNQPLFFSSEEEVWDKVAAVNKSGHGVDKIVHRVFKKIVDEIIERRSDSNFHPLDYPIIRYFLLGKLHLVHLPYVFHPDFLSEALDCWGDDCFRQFFRELSAEDPASFFVTTAALRAVWNCSKYLDRIGAMVTSFHTPCHDVNGSQGSTDVLFTFDGASWHCEVKHLLHPDVSLYCLSHVLAGMLYLEPQGDGLRKYRFISLKGENIDYNFRNEVIEFTHSQISVLLARMDENPKSRRICCQEQGFEITIHSTSRKIILKSISEPSRELTFIFRKDQQARPPHDWYEISPPRACFWPAPLSQQFFKKLSEKIEGVKRQIEERTEHSLGFLYLDLPVAHIDVRISSTEAQKWEQTLEGCLNKSDLPLILMTEPTRLQRNIYVMNHAAKQSRFICPSE